MSRNNPSLPKATSNLCTRLFPAAAGIALAALSACGGGGPPSQLSAAGTESVSQSLTVQFKGCVVDPYLVPNEGVPVRVLGEDGRLLASVRSGRAGEFHLRLPADARMALQVDTDDGESMPIRTNQGDERVQRCLEARAV